MYADRGISGKDIEHRPEMNRLLKDAEEHKFDIVLFWALSRFTRSVSDLYVTLEKFSKENIAMASYTESFDTTSPMGRAMIGVVGVFAQLERELTSERVSAAMQERAEQGKRTCSEVLGYDLLGKDSLVINENEAKYVRFCFEQYTRIRNLSRGSRKQKLHLWRSQYVQSMVEHKTHRLGMHVSHICAWGTSRLAFDGSGRVLRGSEVDLGSYSVCKFQNGKTYNCDLNASYNIGARYFIREILKSVPVKARLALEGKVPQTAKRSTCTLSVLINLNAELVSMAA